MEAGSCALHTEKRLFTVDIDDAGRATVLFAAGVRVADLDWRLVLEDGAVLRTVGREARFTPQPDGIALRIPLDKGLAVLHVVWTVTDAEVRVRVEIESICGQDLRLRELSLSCEPGGLRFQGDWRTWRVYKMGWNVSQASGYSPLGGTEARYNVRFPPLSWMPDAVAKMVFNEGTRFSRRPGDFSSEWFLALTAPASGATVVAGHRGFHRNFGQVFVDASAGALRIVSPLDGVALRPGTRRAIDPIGLFAADDPNDALRAYAVSAAEEVLPLVKPVRLWCSWYSGFWDRVTREELQANLDALRKDDGSLRYFQLDDGYQSAIGDWLTTNARFPKGLEELATTIRDAGFGPGLWTAPFAVAPHSRVFREHPDWVVRDPRGRPVKAGLIMGRFGPRYYYAFDTTIPEVQEHLTALYRELCRMGWRLLKVDFLTAASVAGVRRDPTVSRAEAYRLGFDAVRRGLAEDAFLLGGISPVLINAGLLEIQRLGPDTSFGKSTYRSWLQRVLDDRMTPGIVNNTAGSLVRTAFSDVLFSGDCDAVLTQGISSNEARLLATVNLLCGSSITLGHDFRKSDFDFRLIRELEGCTVGPARVLDLAEDLYPRHLVVPVRRDGSTRWFYAIVNPDDAPAAIVPRVAALPGSPAAVDAVEWWDGRPERLASGTPVTVPPHCARLYELKL